MISHLVGGSQLADAQPTQSLFQNAHSIAAQITELQEQLDIIHNKLFGPQGPKQSPENVKMEAGSLEVLLEIQNQRLVATINMACSINSRF